MDGGAIKWLEKMPNINGNTFEANEAFYGPKIASYPIRINIDFYRFNEFFQNELVYSSKTSKTVGNLSNVSVGNTFQYQIIAKVVDVYDQIVYSANG